MGKNNKKKRRKERQKQQRREQQLSTFGALKLSVKPQDTPPFHHTIQPSVPKPYHPRETAALRLPMKEEPSSLLTSKIDSFGSVSSRIRKLPVVSFVYPKTKEGHSLPYEFGAVYSEAKMPLDAPFSAVNGVSAPVTKQSIDDILYSKPIVESARSSLSAVPGTSGDLTVDRMLDIKSTPSRSLPSISEQARNVTHEENVPRQLYLSGISVEEAVKDKMGLRPRANSTDGELKLPQRGLCDERTVLESYKWRGNIGQGRTAPKGFHNLGNTCFLNSTLQCLAYCPPFCQSLISMLHVDENPAVAPVLVNQPSSGKTSRGRLLTLTLANLFRRVHHPSDRLHGAIAPRRIVDALPHLGSGSSRRNGYKFRPGRQEDAHEFLVHLLDAMNDGELREAGINADQSGWRDRLPVPRLDETTFIHRIFGGYLRSQVRCTDCGYRSNTYDPFLDLSLEISRNSCHSVMSAFHEFTRKETLDTNNRWKCSGCKKRVCATKQLTVFRPPLALCIQLKRFAYGRFGLGGKKISRPIEFPVTLQLPLSDGRSCAYALTGIVIHVGGSANSGHYTAYVRKPCDSGDRSWFHMDDSYVQQVSEQHVLRQRDAYVFLYSRQEVKIEFPTPPLSGSMTAEEAKERMLSRIKARSDVSLNTHAAMVPDTKNASSLQSSTSLARSEKSSNSLLDDSALPQKVASQIENSAPISNSGSSGVHADEGPESDSSNSSESDERKPSSLDLSSPCEVGLSAAMITSTGNSSSVPQSKSFPLSPDSGATSTMMSEASRSTSAHNLVKSKGVLTLVDGYELGKVDVVFGSGIRSKKAWAPKTVDGSKRSNFDLLGNLHVSKWEDDDPNGKTDGHLPLSSAEARQKITIELEKAEQDRKRKMFLDRHDAMLDQGKVSLNCGKNILQCIHVVLTTFAPLFKKLKKVKHKSAPIFRPLNGSNSNPFQRIHGLKQKLIRRQSR